MQSNTKGEWGFKALKQTAKALFRQSRYTEMMTRYEELLQYLQVVTKNQSEKVRFPIRKPARILPIANRWSTPRPRRPSAIPGACLPRSGARLLPPLGAARESGTGLQVMTKIVDFVSGSSDMDFLEKFYDTTVPTPHL